MMFLSRLRSSLDFSERRMQSRNSAEKYSSENWYISRCCAGRRS